jgi:hypothetical protein
MPAVTSALAGDDARFLTVGDFNFPWLMDSPCLLSLATEQRTAAALGAVRLLSVSLDQTSVFEFVGPGTSQPGLIDHTRAAPTSPATRVRLAPDGLGDAGGTAYRAPSRAGQAVFEWSWRVPVALSQVSVGLVTSTARTTAATVSIESPGGIWHTVAAAPGGVGDGGAAPYLLAHLPLARRAIALRVSAQTTGVAEVATVAAIGPWSGSGTSRSD